MTDEPKLPIPSGGNVPEPVPVQPPVLGHAVDAGFVPAPTERPAQLIQAWNTAQPPVQPHFSPPVFGAISVVFGITAFYKATLILAPLALTAGLVACLRKQWGWGLIGIISAVAALAIDPYFWGLAGIYYIARLLGLLS
jgi:choline-glycine betaine transporter